MNRRILLGASATVVVAAAVIFRLPQLGIRVMHADEAVHAAKFGQLLEEHKYRYDPSEFHGPSLNYLTLPVASATGAESLKQVRQVHLRLVPAIFGILLVAAAWPLRKGLGEPAVLAAAALTAVSPAMVFYSRYYIHEALLVFFTFGAIVSFWCALRGRTRLRRTILLALAGVFVGLMHATKETCVIALFAMLTAGVAAAIWCRPAGRWDLRRKAPAIAGGAITLLIVAASVSAIFYSSFLANPGGPVDSIAAYANYIGRASGKAQAAWHVHPWHYYLRVLIGPHRAGYEVWSEGFIVLLAAAGIAAGAIGRGLGQSSIYLVRFLSVYTVVMIVAYSAMPYKTPWCVLGALHGMILLAGIGAAVLVRSVRPRAAKAAIAALLAAGIAHLAWQAYVGSYLRPEDPRNPYVYAHTTADVPALAKAVENIAAASPKGRDMPVQVISPGDDYSPLGWYLRRLNCVSYGSIPTGRPAPVIICEPSVDLAGLLSNAPPAEQHLYIDLTKRMSPDRELQLRPGVPLRAYVRADLLEAADKKEISLPKP
ncbi:MAG: flippase activity-associated protein Agl23 [Planctomycetota bacterium]|jgi:uncharacterized protein (TIGR03663 family)